MSIAIIAIRRGVSRGSHPGIRAWLCILPLLATLGPVDAVACDRAAVPEFAEIAPGHYLREGLHQPYLEAPCGAIANTGFIVGERSVAVIDPGGSRQDGEALLAAVAEVTRLPISHVVLTHSHPDHYFGLAAFSAWPDGEPLPTLVMHARLPAALAQRDGFYRQRFAHLLRSGPDAADATNRSADTLPASVLSLPFSVQTTDERDIIELGERRLQLIATSTAHTDSDLVVLDADSGVAWVGDLLVETRLPSLDGSLLGWQRVLDQLADLPVTQIVPGHGRAGPVDSMLPMMRAYLDGLAAHVRSALRENVGLAALTREAARIADERGAGAPPWQSHWQVFESQHPSNVGKAYTELEWE